MTQSKGLNEASSQILLRSTTFFSEKICKLFILKVDICDTWCVFYILRFIYSITTASNWYFLELHHVLSQSACFVTEDVVHHAELLIEIRWLDHSRQTSVLIKDTQVDSYEVRLHETYHFKSDKKWDRYEVHQSNEPNASLCDDLVCDTVLFIFFAAIKVPCTLYCVWLWHDRGDYGA